MQRVDPSPQPPTIVAPPARFAAVADGARQAFSKVAQVTLAFWIVKICATTVGETGGDALSMTLNLGYVVSTLIFLSFFAVTLFFQLRSHRYHPLSYWAVVVATTTVGTTTSDMLDRTLGLGYVKSTLVELGLVVAVLALWRLVTGSISVNHITSRKNEVFYWVMILVANTLGTALGDFTATTTGLGFERGALVFAGLLALVAVAYFCTRIPRSILFWSAYVLTRPLGATLGDTLTKPYEQGGLALNRIVASLTIVAVMAIIVTVTHRRRHILQPAPRVSLHDPSL